MDYLKLFQTHSEYEDFVSGGTMVKPNVSHCVSENEIHYNPIPYNYGNDYLTFVALEDGTFSFTPQNNNVISYSTDGGETWIEGNSVEVNDGDKVMWKGTLTANYGIGKFGSTANFDIQGNIMSLLYGDNYKGQTDLTGKNYAFYDLLLSNSKLINAENLSLPATTLTDGCYTGMFQGCANLITAPSILPATTLGYGCYNQMFRGCRKLTAAPKLPCTTLVGESYWLMFSGCTSLTVAPELPATTLTYGCYFGMFNGCTSLTTAPELPATTLGRRCYEKMFNGCTSLVNVPELPATVLEESCYYGMFYYCTSLTTAPDLPATTLAKSCYQSMFYGCANLNSITCLATDISASLCTSGWVTGVASSGTFTKAASMSSWENGNNGIPANWTVQDAS